MRKVVLIIVLSFFCVTHSYGQQSLTKEHKEVIVNFINYFKNNDRQKIAEIVSYPLKREYPLAEIKNKKEFLKRYNEVFDAKLIALIVASNPSKEGDWSAVGSKGIMLDNGSLWIDYDGALFAVNYQSDYESKDLANRIAFEKKAVHSSINKFVEPVVVLLTKKYRIRIDNIGAGKFRYASWKKTAKMSDKPDLVIQNGEFIPDGSGGNHHYIFKNGKYVYECGITPIGEEGSSPAYLKIYKADKEILSEPADLVTP